MLHYGSMKLLLLFILQIQLNTPDSILTHTANHSERQEAFRHWYRLNLDKKDSSIILPVLRTLLEKTRTAGDKFNEGLVLATIGHSYFSYMGNDRLAMPWFNKAIAIGTEENYPVLLIYAYEQLGMLSITYLGNYPRSFDYLLRCHKLCLEYGFSNYYSSHNFLLELGRLYYSLGDYRQSLFYLSQIDGIDEKHMRNVPYIKKQRNNTAALWYRKLGDYPRALFR